MWCGELWRGLNASRDRFAKLHSRRVPADKGPCHPVEIFEVLEPLDSLFSIP